MIESLPENIILSDWHQCAVTHVRGNGYGHYPEHTLSLEEYIRLMEISNSDNPDDLLKVGQQVSFKELGVSLEPRFENNNGHPWPMTQRLREQGALLIDHLGLYHELGFLSDPLKKEFLAPYLPNYKAVKGYHQLMRSGKTVMFATGSPAVLAPSLARVAEIAGYSSCTDPYFSAFLTRDNLPEGFWPYNTAGSIGTKLSILEYYRKTYGKAPPLIDDVIELNELASFLFGADSFNPFSEQVAEKRRMHQFPDYLRPFIISNPGKIHFGVDLEEIDTYI